MKLLIRPAAEVAIKSKPVRRQQMRQLRQNIRKLLARLENRLKPQNSGRRRSRNLPGSAYKVRRQSVALGKKSKKTNKKQKIKFKIHLHNKYVACVRIMKIKQ